MNHHCILITGGAGFIGSWFVRKALRCDSRSVVALDKLTYAGNKANLAGCWNASGFSFIEGDIGDQQLVAQLLDEHRPKGIVHFAAESHVDRSIDGVSPFLQTNVVGTVALLESTFAYWRGMSTAEQAQFRFLQVSTDEVYGPVVGGEFREGDRFCPTSPYAASKAAADHFVHAYYLTFGLPTMTTHCTNNYGPYQFPEKLIPLMIHKAASGQSLPVYGDGQQVRDWLYVEDHCRALEAVLERGRPGQTYHISAGDLRTNLQVVQTILESVAEQQSEKIARNSAARIEFVTDRPAHDRRYALNAEKVRQKLGWAPKVVFGEGLWATVHWYLKNREWVETVTDSRYGFERLGRTA